MQAFLLRPAVVLPWSVAVAVVACQFPAAGRAATTLSIVSTPTPGYADYTTYTFTAASDAGNIVGFNFDRSNGSGLGFTGDFLQLQPFGQPVAMRSSSLDGGPTSLGLDLRADSHFLFSSNDGIAINADESANYLGAAFNFTDFTRAAPSLTFAQIVARNDVPVDFRGQFTVIASQGTILERVGYPGEPEPMQPPLVPEPEPTIPKPTTPPTPGPELPNPTTEVPPVIDPPLVEPPQVKLPTFDPPFVDPPQTNDPPSVGEPGEPPTVEFQPPIAEQPIAIDVETGYIIDSFDRIDRWRTAVDDLQWEWLELHPDIDLVLTRQIDFDVILGAPDAVFPTEAPGEPILLAIDANFAYLQGRAAYDGVVDVAGLFDLYASAVAERQMIAEPASGSLLAVVVAVTLLAGPVGRRWRKVKLPRP